jgi:TonB-linked SusC/RagA family outer membrane protein
MQKIASCNRKCHVMPVSSRYDRRFSTKILLVMKLTVLLLTVAFMGVSAKSISQSVTLSGKNIKLEKIFSTIRSQTGYLVFCDRDLLNDAQPITVAAQAMPLHQFLDVIFRNQSLQYLIREQTIFVSKKEVSGTLLFPIPDELLKTVPVQGRVTDITGNLLAGATIKIKGSTRSVLTDESGKFTMTVNIGDVLIISYIGFQSQELTIGNSTDLTIKLQQAIIAMNEVQVNVSDGYQTISKERSTGAYGIVTAKDIAAVPSNNILQRLEGKVPGVRFDIRTNKIQVRSVNTYTTNTAPLIVIDGFPMLEIGSEQTLTTIGNTTMANSSILSKINPADIEQITFLKDAVATSIWGSKGANGVIVIETKRGKKGAPVVSVSSTVSVAKPPAISKLHWMNSAQYVDLERELVEKNFITDAKQSPYYAPLSAYNPSEAQEWLFKVQRGTATQAEADAALAEISSRNNQSQIEKYLLQTAVTQQHNLSISGGGDNNTYYISANYNKDMPIYRSNKGENMIVTANLTNDLFNKRVKLRTGINYMYAATTTNNAAIDALGLTNTSLRPYDMLLDANGNRIRRNILFRPEVGDSLVKLGYLPFTYNAIDELNYSNTKSVANQIRLNTGITAPLTKWLTLDVSGMYQRNMSEMLGIDEIQSYTGRVFVNQATTISSTTGKPVYNLPYGGIYRLNNGTQYDYNLRGQLNLNYSFNPDHQVTAIAGSEIREAYSKTYGSTQYGYDPDANSFGTVNPTTPYATMYGWTTTIGNPFTSPSIQRTRYLSYYGNASYVYKSRYNLSGSARFDDYTQLGLSRNKRAKPFWSAGFKWNAEQEAFLQNIAWLNNLGVRVTYGTSGKVPVGGYYATVVSLNATDPNTQQPIGTIQNPANQQLGWETTRTLNEGVDINVFNNRLSASIDVYQKRSSGILTTLPYNPTYGWSSLLYNTGQMKSGGMELGITGKLLDQKDWSIVSTFNFSYSRTKVTDNRYNNITAANLIAGSSPVTGYPVSPLFVYRSAGLDPATGQTQIYDRNNNIIRNTTNLTAAFDINDLKFAGVRSAPYYGGFFNTFRYKRFELGVQTTYYFGHVFLKPSVNNYPVYSIAGVLGRQEDLAYRWKQTGDELFTDVPGLTGANANSINRYKTSDKLVRKADNIRLQQISLAYNVPAKLLPKGVFKSLSISGNVRNLGMIWAANKEKLDPEYLNANSNYYSMPPVTSYVFNINASF